jgi:hypothetical protein
MSDPAEESGHPQLGWIIGTLMILVIVGVMASLWIHVHGA